jgi:predicted TIM-barrel fold metal-dependent hydrolase
MLDRYGLARGVLVQPSVYGFDNRCMLEALDRADGRLIGIAVPDPNSSPGDLEEMHRRGVRGVRCNLLNPGGLSAGAVVAWLPVLRAMDWHVELHVDVEAIGDLKAYVERFGIPVVIDHMGRPPPGEARPDSPGLSRLVDLVREGGCFVKLSAPYRLSTAPPPWPDVGPLAQALLSANPAACLWASDWPHTDTPKAVDPDHLFEALDDWTDDPERRRIIMAEAPAGLYGPTKDQPPPRTAP